MAVMKSKKPIRARGFTLIELMTVVAIVGILVGMSIGGYNQWRRSVATKEVRSDLQGVASAMDNSRNFNNVYPSGATALSQVSFTASAGVTLTYTVIYHLDSTNGNKTPEVGTC